MNNKLLIVIDMQNDFITGVLGNDACRCVVTPVIDRMKQARAEGWKILCTKDTHEENYLQTGEGKRLPVPHCIRGSQGNDLIDEIKELHAQWHDADEVFLPIHPFEKPAFGSTSLSKELASYDFDEIELIGVCTDICVLSNAIILRSDYPNIEVAVRASCCAGVTPESHDTALRAMAGCQITIRP